MAPNVELGTSTHIISLNFRLEEEYVTYVERTLCECRACRDSIICGSE